MRLTAIKFRGYAAGHTYFATVFNSAAEVERERILSVIERIAAAITVSFRGAGLTGSGAIFRRKAD